jgi:hypothetical protein
MRTTASKTSQKVIDGAMVLMKILQDIGPGPRTGLSGEIARVLERSVSPREFDQMVQYCRRVLGPNAGKAVVIKYSDRTFQYGFAEDLEHVERYIIQRNNSYAASRAETMAAVCGAGITQHGPSLVLSMSKELHESYARNLRTMLDAYDAEHDVERWAKRTGADAPTQLEERVR